MVQNPRAGEAAGRLAPEPSQPLLRFLPSKCSLCIGKSREYCCCCCCYILVITTWLHIITQIYKRGTGGGQKLYSSLVQDFETISMKGKKKRCRLQLSSFHRLRLSPLRFSLYVTAMMNYPCAAPLVVNSAILRARMLLNLVGYLCIQINHFFFLYRGVLHAKSPPRA